MRLQIDSSLGAGYTVADLDGDIATEVVRSDAGLREVLKLMRAPKEVTEDVIIRLNHERSIQVSF